MAVPNKCRIRCNTKGTSGITKVIVSQDNYDKISMISNITRKSMQEITAELLSYAIKNCEIVQDDGTTVNLKIE